MTDTTPLTSQQLDAIDARAASLHEYATLTDGPFQADADELTGVDVPALLTEIRRLREQLECRTEALAFLERTTLPELRRTVQHHQDGKQRWRARAEKAEARVAELEGPAVDDQPDTEATEETFCDYGVTNAHGSGCILPAGHQPPNRHVVTPGDEDDD